MADVYISTCRRKKTVRKTVRREKTREPELVCLALCCYANELIKAAELIVLNTPLRNLDWQEKLKHFTSNGVCM